jgi:hypothetical protein
MAAITIEAVDIMRAVSEEETAEALSKINHDDDDDDDRLHH